MISPSRQNPEKSHLFLIEAKLHGACGVLTQYADVIFADVISDMIAARPQAPGYFYLDRHQFIAVTLVSRIALWGTAT
jgi:hypothetical protein